jgi:hypothetical protein
MTEQKGKYVTTHGGKRTAGPGKKMGRPRTHPLDARPKGQHGGPRTAGAGKKMGRPTTHLGTDPIGLMFYVDAETIAVLQRIDPNRSKALRILAHSLD